MLQAEVVTTEFQYMNWLNNDGTLGHFIMDLGCTQSFQQILLRNCHNGLARDRSTNEFR